MGGWIYRSEATVLELDDVESGKKPITLLDLCVSSWLGDRQKKSCGYIKDPLTLVGRPQDFGPRSIAKMPAQQFRAWCFTNFDLNIKYEVNDKIKYICWQIEQPDGVLPHQQGYVEFHKKLAGKGAATALGFPICKKGEKLGPGRNYHLEPRVGTQDQARDYCMNLAYCDEHHNSVCGCPASKLKGRIDGPWEFGVKDIPGARTDLKSVAEKIVAGSTVTTVALSAPVLFIKYHGGIEKLARYAQAPKTWKPYVIWAWGATGLNKSRLGRDIYPENTFFKMPGNDWFDGYEGHEVAIFDDYRKNWFTFSFLLNLLDHGELVVPVKGRSVQWRPKVVYITCCKSWKDLYTNDGELREDIGQLSRRIDMELKFPLNSSDEEAAIVKIRQHLVDLRDSTNHDKRRYQWDGVTRPTTPGLMTQLFKRPKLESSVPWCVPHQSFEFEETLDEVEEQPPAGAPGGPPEATP